MEVPYRTVAQRKALRGKPVTLTVLDTGGWYTYAHSGTVEKVAGDEIKIDGDWIKVDRITRIETPD